MRALSVTHLTGGSLSPLTYTDQHVTAILAALHDDPDEPWRPEDVSDVQHVVAYAANAGVAWASRVSVWDISDEDGGHFLVTLDLDRISQRRLAGMATALKHALGEETGGPSAVRHILDHIHDQAARMLAAMPEVTFAVE